MQATQLGPYVLEERLGAGGFGAVWAGRHVETGARRALKVVPLADADAALRFQREAEAAARLDGHPHVVRVHGAFVEQGRGVLVTELVEGAQDLGRRLAASGPLDPAHAARVVGEVAAAVAHAHARGVLHRDLKPSNVLLDPAGRALLVDLGLARLADQAALTATGVAAGTPEFLAPEQALGAAQDERTDVFGLGALLFACLTGRPPRAGASPGEVLARAAREPIPPVTAHRPDAPPGLVAAVARATALDPADRFPSATGFAAALGGGGVAARPRRAGAAAALAGLVASAAALALAVAASALSPGRQGGGLAAPAPGGRPPAGVALTRALAALEVASQDATRPRRAAGTDRPGSGDEPVAAARAWLEAVRALEQAGRGAAPAERARVQAALQATARRWHSLLRERAARPWSAAEEEAAHAMREALAAAEGPAGPGAPGPAAPDDEPAARAWAATLDAAAAEGDAAAAAAARRARAAFGPAARPGQLTAALAPLAAALDDLTTASLAARDRAGTPEAARRATARLLRLATARTHVLGLPDGPGLSRLVTLDAQVVELDDLPLLGLAQARLGVSRPAAPLGRLAPCWFEAAPRSRLLALASMWAQEDWGDPALLEPGRFEAALGQGPDTHDELAAARAKRTPGQAEVLASIEAVLVMRVLRQFHRAALAARHRGDDPGLPEAVRARAAAAVRQALPAWTEFGPADRHTLVLPAVELLLLVGDDEAAGAAVAALVAHEDALTRTNAETSLRLDALALVSHAHRLRGDPVAAARADRRAAGFSQVAADVQPELRWAAIRHFVARGAAALERAAPEEADEHLTRALGEAEAISRIDGKFAVLDVALEAAWPWFPVAWVQAGAAHRGPQEAAARLALLRQHVRRADHTACFDALARALERGGDLSALASPAPR